MIFWCYFVSNDNDCILLYKMITFFNDNDEEHLGHTEEDVEQSSDECCLGKEWFGPTNDVRRKNIAAVIAQSKFLLDHVNVGLP